MPDRCDWPQQRKKRRKFERLLPAMQGNGTEILDGKRGWKSRDFADSIDREIPHNKSSRKVCCYRQEKTDRLVGSAPFEFQTVIFV